MPRETEKQKAAQGEVSIPIGGDAGILLARVKYTVAKFKLRDAQGHYNAAVIQLRRLGEPIPSGPLTVEAGPIYH